MITFGPENNPHLTNICFKIEDYPTYAGEEGGTQTEKAAPVWTLLSCRFCKIYQYKTVKKLPHRCLQYIYLIYVRKIKISKT